MTNTQPPKECSHIMATRVPETAQIHLLITEIQVLSTRDLKFQQGHKLPTGFRQNLRTKASAVGVLCNKTLSNFIHLYHFKS